jgi:hypothetical protein
MYVICLERPMLRNGTSEIRDQMQRGEIPIILNPLLMKFMIFCGLCCDFLVDSKGL